MLVYYLIFVLRACIIIMFLPSGNIFCLFSIYYYHSSVRFWKKTTIKFKRFKKFYLASTFLVHKHIKKIKKLAYDLSIKNGESFLKNCSFKSRKIANKNRILVFTVAIILYFMKETNQTHT